MAEPRKSIGQRITEWWQSFSHLIGLDVLLENERKRREEWLKTTSVADLKEYAKRYPGVPPYVLARRAKDLGATDEEVLALAQPGLDEAISNPSLWVAEQMTKAFRDPNWHEFQEVMGALVIDPWLASITGGKIKTDAPEIENVRRFLGNIASMEALGNLVSLIVETLSAGQIDNAGRMFSEAKWTLGTCFTSWQATSPIVQAVILEPLQKLVNQTFRPTDFTRSQWEDLYALGKIDAWRLREELRRQGYTDEKIGWLLDLAEQKLSRSDIIALWNKGRFGDVECARRLRQLGYSSEAIADIMFLGRKEQSEENKGVLLSTLKTAFKKQLIDESRFRESMAKLGYSREAIDLEIAVAKLSWEIETKTAAKSDIEAAYKQDVIGRPEAEHWLAEAGFTAHDIKVIIDTWDKERAPRYKTINKAEILQAWGVGVLTQPEAYQRLRDVGYTADDAAVLMETYAKAHLGTKPPADKKLSDTDIMWAWHAEVIEENEALAKLQELGWSAEDAHIIFETFERLHPRISAKIPKELSRNDILEAWGRKVITEDECYQRLVGVGYTEADAHLLMSSYEVRPEALPRQPTVSELIAACRRGVIDQAVLSQKLTQLGLPEESVQFYVAYAVAPLPEKTRNLSRSDIIELWTKHRHDRAWALERLLALNYAPEDAEDILWLASPRIEDTETYILWTHGFIDDNIAIAMWLAMGFTQEQIDAVIGGE